MDTTEKIEEKQPAQRYEIVCLIANKYSEEEVAPIIGAIAKLVQDNGGTVIAEENWGKRKLAYPIKHFFHAYYHLIECVLPKSAAQKIDNLLRLDEQLLRHLIVQKRVKTDAEIARERAAQERIAKEQEKAAASAENAVKTKTATESAHKEKPAVDMAALDAKLDKILDDTEDLL
jgi:small subunit ribosomal protein S6